jgi:hypothetical protein
MNQYYRFMTEAPPMQVLAYWQGLAQVTVELLDGG